jgi:predicted protein tyrosine phosphatase
MNPNIKIHFSIMPFEKWRQVSKLYPYDHIVIGYRTPKITYHPILFSPYCKGHLELWVHDYGVRDSGPGLIIFSKNHAKKILELVEREKNNVHHIICQCDAGISRSSATAAAISKILYNDDSFVFDSHRYVPNSHIYQTILKTNFESEIPLLNAL